MDTWHCESCYPDALEIGMIFPGCSLMLYEKQYHILGGQGHSGDIIFTFENEPFANPDPECNTQDPRVAFQSDRWCEQIFQPLSKSLLMPASDGYQMITEAQKLGYDRRDAFENWLANRC